MTKRNILLSLLLILGLVGTVPRLAAWAVGAEYIPYNANLEGARILSLRNRLSSGDFPPANVWLAGTSRTMADFSAGEISALFTSLCGRSKPVSVFNLGNVANSFGDFLKVLQNKENLPEILILELSPHMLLRGARSEVSSTTEPVAKRTFVRYRQSVATFELWLTGWFRKVTAQQDPLVLHPKVTGALMRQILSGADPTALFYTWRVRSSGYGQVLQEGGQVVYRIYLPDRAAANLVGGEASEYESFRSSVLIGGVEEAEIQALLGILEIYKAPRQIVIVRPPVHAELYALEDTVAGQTMARVRQLLAQRGIPFMDLNPHGLSTIDRSHVDWFDTSAASQLFADRISALPSLPGTICRALEAP